LHFACVRIRHRKNARAVSVNQQICGKRLWSSFQGCVRFRSWTWTFSVKKILMIRLTTSQKRLIKVTLTAKPYPLTSPCFGFRQNVPLLFLQGEGRRRATRWGFPFLVKPAASLSAHLLRPHPVSATAETSLSFRKERDVAERQGEVTFSPFAFFELFSM
jgi:hypothetical protein